MPGKYPIGLRSIYKDELKTVTDRYSVRKRLEYYLPLFRTAGNVQYHPIDEVIVRRHIADFYGLLASFHIPRGLFWIIMRVNRLHSPSDFNRSFTKLIIPDITLVERIIRTTQSTDQAKFRKQRKK